MAPQEQQVSPRTQTDAVAGQPKLSSEQRVMIDRFRQAVRAVQEGGEGLFDFEAASTYNANDSKAAAVQIPACGEGRRAIITKDDEFLARSCGDAEGDGGGCVSALSSPAGGAIVLPDRFLYRGKAIAAINATRTEPVRAPNDALERLIDVLYDGSVLHELTHKTDGKGRWLPGNETRSEFASYSAQDKHLESHTGVKGATDEQRMELIISSYDALSIAESLYDAIKQNGAQWARGVAPGSEVFLRGFERNVAEREEVLASGTVPAALKDDYTAKLNSYRRELSTIRLGHVEAWGSDVGRDILHSLHYDLTEDFNRGLQQMAKDGNSKSANADVTQPGGRRAHVERTLTQLGVPPQFIAYLREYERYEALQKSDPTGNHQFPEWPNKGRQPKL
jgi:hypothetical protein